MKLSSAGMNSVRELFNKVGLTAFPAVIELAGVMIWLGEAAPGWTMPALAATVAFYAWWTFTTCQVGNMNMEAWDMRLHALLSACGGLHVMRFCVCFEGATGLHVSMHSHNQLTCTASIPSISSRLQLIASCQQHEHLMLAHNRP
jgi:hypothetical protein